MSADRHVITYDDTDTDQSGYVELFQGAPFSGLIVAVLQSGEVTELAEYENGRPHGYTVGFQNGRPALVDEYDRGTPHGLRATWDGTRLTGASRYQYGIEDQRLRVDGSIEDLPGYKEKIERVHAHRGTHALISESVPDLLAGFEAAWQPLLDEARRGLGLG